MEQRSGMLAREESFGPFADTVVAEPSPKRVSARLDGQQMLASDRALLAWIEGPTPDFALPRGDLASEVFALGDEESSERLGTVRVVVHAATGQRAGLLFVDPPASAPALADHVVLDWDSVDAWFVEGERQRGHPRDPYRRIDVHETSREIVVEIDEARLATSTRALAVFETGLPIRYYLPESDVRVDLLEASTTVTRCAYKGEAEHYHANVRGERFEDVAWRYPAPEPRFGVLQDRFCFYNERVSLIVDGEPAGTPDTPWS
jgi:uncharacterized protein (DUF427 family)